MKRIAWLLLIAAAVAPAAAVRRPKPQRRIPVHKRIAALLQTESARSARWAILVRSLATGRTVYQLNSADHLTPASNTKLFSTSLAMERLGPGHRFVTTLRADGTIANGRIEGDLRLVGGGDPTLSARVYPYTKDAEPGNPLAALEEFAGELTRKGVREITGDIVGDDRLYVYQPYPEGWTVDDSIWDYGAPVSALPFNDNAFTVILDPGEKGSLARLRLNPPWAPLLIDNRVWTSPNGPSSVLLDRAPGSRQVRLTGTIHGSAVRLRLAVDDPALFAAHALQEALSRRGIRIQGEATAVHRYHAADPFDGNHGVELARRESPPLTEVARVVNKVSQNLHAELLLREVARVRQNQATREAGLQELKALLTEVGVKDSEYHFEDGSGLSRRGVVSPEAIVKLLTYMDSRSYRDVWDSLLPLGGADGTLGSRFEQAPQARVIHAKTGTLGTANALSGYLTTRRGARLVFSILANNHTVPASEIRKTIDRIGLALLDWEGR